MERPSTHTLLGTVPPPTDPSKPLPPTMPWQTLQAQVTAPVVAPVGYETVHVDPSLAQTASVAIRSLVAPMEPRTMFGHATAADLLAADAARRVATIDVPAPVQESRSTAQLSVLKRSWTKVILAAMVAGATLLIGWLIGSMWFESPAVGKPAVPAVTIPVVANKANEIAQPPVAADLPQLPPPHNDVVQSAVSPTPAQAAVPAVQVANQDSCSAAFVSSPPGAAVLIDNAPAGITPLIVANQSCGATLAVTIAKSGFETQSRRITLRQRQSNSMRVSLRTPPALLRIESIPAGATVFVDGKTVGVSPVQVDLSSGVRHKIGWRLAEHAEHTMTVVPSPGVNDALTASLRIVK
jgi:hypothetical protein